MNGAQASCQPPPDTQLWLWMESDLALTTYRGRQYVIDRRFNGLLSAAVPDLQLEDGELFRDVLKARMFLPQSIELHGDRYLVGPGASD